MQRKEVRRLIIGFLFAAAAPFPALAGPDLVQGERQLTLASGKYRTWTVSLAGNSYSNPVVLAPEYPLATYKNVPRQDYYHLKDNPNFVFDPNSSVYVNYKDA